MTWGSRVTSNRLQYIRCPFQHHWSNAIRVCTNSSSNMAMASGILWNCQFCANINSLAPEKFEWNFRYVIFKWILVIDGWGISCEIALIWMSLDFTDDQSTLVQVMARCRQATSHYLSQCWPRFLSPYGVTRPQWVNTLNKMVSILQMAFSSAWFVFRVYFHCVLFPKVLFDICEPIMAQFCGACMRLQ